MERLLGPSSRLLGRPVVREEGGLWEEGQALMMRIDGPVRDSRVRGMQ